MHPKILFSVVALAVFPALQAQTSPAIGTSSNDALKARADLVTSLANGSISLDSALTDLKSQVGPFPGGNANYAIAAIDLGERLLVAHKATEAEAFFREADKVLSGLIAQTSDKSARDKVQYLSARAHVRANFLNQAADAKADMDAALKLQPDDAQLQSMRRNLAGARSAVFSEQPKG
jgi:hypothetical protein